MAAPKAIAGVIAGFLIMIACQVVGLVTIGGITGQLVGLAVGLPICFLVGIWIGMLGHRSY